MESNSHSTGPGLCDGLEGQEKKAWQELGADHTWIYEQWYRPDGNIGIRRRQFAKYDSYEYLHTMEDGTQIWTQNQNYSE